MMRRVFLVLLMPLLFAGASFSQDESGSAPVASAPCSIQTNSDTTLTNWKTCAQTACDPGGTGVPTSTTQTTGNTIASKTAMEFAQTAQASNQTNVLWPHNQSNGCDKANVFTSDFWLYIPSTFAGAAGSGGAKASAFEIDMYDFCLTCTAGGSTTGIRYMYGMQFCELGAGCPSGVNGIDLCGNDNCAWTYSGQNPSLSFDTWHHVLVHNHRVPAEVTSKPCSYVLGGTTFNVPSIYFDDVVIDGTTYPLNMSFCANINPATWQGSGNQFQIDISSNATAYSVGMYLNTNTFQAAY